MMKKSMKISSIIVLALLLGGIAVLYKSRKMTVDPDGIVETVLNGMVWISIDDSGAGMKDWDANPIRHGGFSGKMSKYETTNAKYCQYLNAALVSGDVTVVGNDVKGASGPYSEQDYYDLAGSGYTYNGATNGGAARINYDGNSFTVDIGFDNHPVTYVSWYGATAFASYYSYRLPTEREWRAVADYDGSFTYGCGTSINNSIANYGGDSTHPDGTTIVGSFGAYGYGMCDMAGNVSEWTSSLEGLAGSSRVVRGGCWHYNANNCRVLDRNNGYPYDRSSLIGFRVCLD